MRNAAYLAGIVLTIAAASHFAFELSRAGTSAFFLVMAVPTVALAILGVLRARHDGVLKSWISVKSGDFSRGFAAAVVLFGAAYAFTKTVAPPESIRASWLAPTNRDHWSPQSVGMVVVAIIVMAIAEELLWRGLVVSLLKASARAARGSGPPSSTPSHAPTIWALQSVASANRHRLPPSAAVSSEGRPAASGGCPGVFSHVSSTGP